MIRQQHQATLTETLSFVVQCGPSVRAVFFIGIASSILNGCVYPALAYVFSVAFANLSASSIAAGGTEQVAQAALLLVYVGAYGFVVSLCQAWCFERSAHCATQELQKQWFAALLRQDPSWYDVHDIRGIASQVAPLSQRYRKGVGRRFGEGVQWTVTIIGGLGYAFYSCWQVALVVVACIPMVAGPAFVLLKLNQAKGVLRARAYAGAGSVAHETLAALRTILSLNAVQKSIERYSEKTLLAFDETRKLFVKEGIANGGITAGFIVLYCVLTLFGSYLLYPSVRMTGCDPSDSVVDNTPCGITGREVFSAMLGVAFAAQGMSQVGNFFGDITAARIAAHQANRVIQRQPGAPEERIYEEDEAEVEYSDNHTSDEYDVEKGKKKLKAILPAFKVDVSSNNGLKPERFNGEIVLEKVCFSYPTRPDSEVLQGLDLRIKAGETVALVGPSGGGKSSIVAMIERFYDPTSGKVTIDGIDLRDLNVSHYRKKIGYVGQEPVLFSMSIRENIRFGKPDATLEEIEAAAKLANASAFIEALPDKYDTQCGEKGSQMSGGMKQRIAIARVLVSNPDIFILDEATSALDQNSERVVQAALDNIVKAKSITTIIIAHRLTTIRNVDRINVISAGKLLECGSHDELMSKDSFYKKFVERQQGEKPDQHHEKVDRESDVARQSMLRHSLTSAPTTIPLLEFTDVVFDYPSRPNKMVFNNFNLTVLQGETVALVGPSGSGKSTAVGLIERFYDPSSGEVKFNGHNLKTLNLRWYREQIGYVGQEPLLFGDSIANNIAYGAPNATREEIIEAATKANCHEFIEKFENGYDAFIGSATLSGGQKQKIAIARALVKSPALLILDEANSALDQLSEAIVQESIEKLMSENSKLTVVMIAHRLSSVRNADAIAFVEHGRVVEYGTHDELIAYGGRYKRLYETSQHAIHKEETENTLDEPKKAETTSPCNEIEGELQVENKAFLRKRVYELMKPDLKYSLIGSIGAFLAGLVFPAWGALFSLMIAILFTTVPPCDHQSDPLGCEFLWNQSANQMQAQGFHVAIYWAILFAACLIGNIIAFWGFGMASERLNKRVRDTSFTSLLRQEVAYFDVRRIGSVISGLQNDASQLHSYVGEPIRSFLIALASAVTGIVVSFVFAWPVGLVILGLAPVFSFAGAIEKSGIYGKDEGVVGQAEAGSPSAILVETLDNIRTVAAMSLENHLLGEFDQALSKAGPSSRLQAFMSGVTSGSSILILQWSNALLLYFAGYLLVTYPRTFTYQDLLIAIFAITLSLPELSTAYQNVSDRSNVEQGVKRIFELIDRKSSIDPLSDEGMTLELQNQ